MTDLNDLHHMKVKMSFVKTQDPVDIHHIPIDTQLSALERMEKYLKDIQNPYCFLCGNLTVHVCFSDNGKELSIHLKQYFSIYNQ